MSDLFDFKPAATAFAVMGNPVAHSRSPEIHVAFARQTGVALTYERIHVDTGGFDQAVSHFAANGGAGLNITAPFKVEAWRLCGDGAGALSERARAARAVNTLQFKADGSTYGDNTDGAGLVTDLEHNLGVELAGRDLLILGAGGAVRGVLGALAERGPRRLVVANRTASKAREICAGFGEAVTGVGLDRIPPPGYDVIINGTSMSLGGGLPAIDESLVSLDTLIYDMTYADQPTPFMTWGLSLGAARASDGLGMLVEQAAESFRLWHGRDPDTRPVIDALRKDR